MDTALDTRPPHVASPAAARRLGTAIYGALVLVLLFLASFAVWAAATTQQATARADHATILSDDYQQARYWIGAEKVLERTYRLAPGPAVLAAHHAAGHALQDALGAIQHDGDAPDRALVAALMVKQRAYLDATWHGLFPAVDARQTARVISVDHGVVAPVFGYIERHMSAAADAEHRAALAATRTLDNTRRWILTTTLIIFLLGMGLLLALWTVLRVDHHRIDDALRHAAEREVERVKVAVDVAVAVEVERVKVAAEAEVERVKVAAEAEVERVKVAAEAKQRAVHEAAMVEQDAMRRSEARFRALVHSASDLIVVMNAAGIISYVSPSIETMLGYNDAAMRGANWLDLIHPDDVGRVRQIYTEILATPGARAFSETRARHRDGSWRVLEVNRTNLLDQDDVGGIVLNARDVTERAAFEEQLQHQAFHDLLTGLPNRALFLDRLEHALARAARQGESAAVLFLDLNRFKVVNDSLGHDAGDQLLVALAARVRACLREEDTVARFGGDEFAILLSELGALGDLSGVARTAERIITALEAPFQIGGHAIVAAASVGVVTSTPGVTSAGLLGDADVALYRAKAQGRGRYQVFDETMHARALERLELEADLRLALERGEFQVYYQPKVELATGRVAGMEALVRWQSPTRGFVAPVAFIPLAEETGLIQPLGHWVLEEACRQTTRWNAGASEADAIVVSVNLSARQFAHPPLVADVARALAESGVEPRQIQLEITESVAMDDAEATVTTLRRLKDLGVELAIDDFGTGYSSLAYLKRFPVDALKIDRAFVSGLERDSEDASIVNAVVSLGHALRMAVVAEGVETAEESAQLCELGCELGQGYYWARPLPAEQVDAFVRQRRARAA